MDTEWIGNEKSPTHQRSWRLARFGRGVGVSHSKSGLPGGLAYKQLSVAIWQPVAGEKAVINELVGAKAAGTGTLHGKPVQFKCVIVGDRDNSKPNTLVVIVVTSEGPMKRQSRQIASALDSVRTQDTK